jgi:hypothetical protein
MNASNANSANSANMKMAGGRRRGYGTRRGRKAMRGTRRMRGGQGPSTLSVPAAAPAAAMPPAAIPGTPGALSAAATSPGAAAKPMMGGRRGKMVGSKAQVWHGTAHHTKGGLTKKDLMKHKGRIVSKRKHALGKKAFKKLVKAGYKPKKGTFKLFRK